MGLAHWDEVESSRRAKGEMDATWQRLGDAAGTKGVGLNRICVAPGKLPTPPHSHGASEEVYYVLAGSGLAWQDGQVHEVRPRDCVIHRANELEHTFVAGPDGLDFLAFGTRHPTEIGWLPRSRAVRFGWPWVEGSDDDPWDLEAEAGPLVYGDPAPRPPNILNVDEVEHEQWQDRVTSAPMATRERSDQAGFHWERLAPGKSGSVPHCHSEEEEIFVILEGGGTLRLGDEQAPIRAGHVLGRPPGTRVAHSFRAGEKGMTYLAYGTREVNDIAYYPDSDKVNFRGIGLITRLERLDYWDDEPED
jgi:uncharacterized cupin superfamily protein